MPPSWTAVNFAGESREMFSTDDVLRVEHINGAADSQSNSVYIDRLHDQDVSGCLRGYTEEKHKCGQHGVN